MHKSIDNLISIQNGLKIKFKDIKIPEIIAVSKTFPLSEILPIINHGQIHFGENKVQEAVEKWTKIKNDFEHIKLHMIGKLQSNKVKFVIPIFDYIHSLDSLKLAKKIATEQLKANKRLKIFIQINIGKEAQKNGIEIDQLNSFYEVCTKELGLNIVGLMCLPPKNKDSSNYFLSMKKLSDSLNIKELSMGMSQDYSEAAENGSSFLRIGSKIFGKRV